MNRRDLLKSLAMLPAVGLVRAEASEWPDLIGVEETPWLIGKVAVTVDGMRMYRAVRACRSEGWCEILGKPRNGYLTHDVWRGEVEFHTVEPESM